MSEAHWQATWSSLLLCSALCRVSASKKDKKMRGAACLIVRLLAALLVSWIGGTVGAVVWVAAWHHEGGGGCLKAVLDMIRIALRGGDALQGRTASLAYEVSPVESRSLTLV
jgi:hypothetical protein